MPSDPRARAEVQATGGVVRRQVPPRSDQANLVYERVNKKVMRAGYPDGKAVKAGATAIKYHLRYMAWLLDRRRWLAGDRMTLADFAAAAHLSCLDYISDVDWNRSSQPVKDWYAKIKSRPAFRSILVRPRIPRLHLSRRTTRTSTFERPEDRRSWAEAHAAGFLQDGRLPTRF
jgi:glutathione S-transferase